MPGPFRRVAQLPRLRETLAAPESSCKGFFPRRFIVPIVAKSIAGLRSPILFKPASPLASATSQAYWCENGAVYQMPSAGSSATIIVGFQNYTGYIQYCQRTANWQGVPPPSFYGRTAFSSQDFPVAQDIAPNPNPTPLYDQCQVFASQNAAGLA